MGTPKTGTTYLQRVCWRARPLLAERGLRLPGRRLHHHFLACLDVAGLADHLPRTGEVEGAWERLLDEVAQGAGTWLISHELFALASAEQAEAAVAAATSRGIAVEVVLTARDELRQVPAQWQEHLKHRSDFGLADYLDGLEQAPPGTQDIPGLWMHWPAPDALEVARRWRPLVPRLHVVTVPPRGADPALLWQRFCTVLGIAPDGVDLDSARGNESIRTEQAELLRRVNAALGDRLPLPGPYTDAVKGELAHAFLGGRPGAPVTLPAAARARAVRRSGEVVEGLQRLEVEVVGDLEELRSVDDPQAADPVAPSTEAVLEEAVAALAHVLTRLEEESRGRRDAVRRLRRLQRESPAPEASAPDADRPARRGLLRGRRRRTD